MKKINRYLLKKLMLFLLLFAVIFDNTAYAKQNTKAKPETTDPKIKITAKSAIVMDLSTGAILYGKDIHKKMYPASITKIMTALVALEQASLSEVVTFSHDAVFNVDPYSSRLWVAEGEKFTMENCLYGMMLASANDLAYGISEKVAGSYSGFIDMMNQKAAEIGCRKTNFTNPHGLYEKEHYTTAYDMALISREAFKSNIFRTIVSTKDYTIPKSNKAESRYLYQHHKMIYNNSYHYEWFAGGKTGYTSDTGNTLVTYAKKKNRTLVCILFRPSDKYVQYKESKMLLNYGFDQYDQIPLYSNAEYETPFLSLTVPNASVYVSLPKDASVSEVTQTITALPSPSAQSPIARVEYKYGSLTVGIRDIFSLPLPDYLKKDEVQSESNSETKPEKKKKKTHGFVILFLLFILLFLFYFCFYIFYLLPKQRKRNSYAYRRRHGNPKRR